MMGTIERARGRWREILPRLGIDARFLVNKHGPCPLCGGRDRFRFDDKGGAGSYFCGQCGPGPGLLLLRKMHGWDFRAACDQVDAIIGTDAPATTKVHVTPHADQSQRRRADLERVITAATDRTIVERYMRGRGLGVIPGVLHGHRDLDYFDDDYKRVGSFPAMVAPVLGPDGALQSVHRTYITSAIEKAERKKLMRAVETVKGGAVRLFDHGDALGIGEGIETCVAVHELFGMPTWGMIATSIMEGFIPPAGLERLIIFADNDSNFAGQKAAYALANRLVQIVPRVEVMVPPEPDTDWLDVLNERRAGRMAS